MPSGQRRGARAKRLVRAFVKLTTWQANRARCREREERKKGVTSIPSLKSLLRRLHSRHEESEDSTSDDETASFLQSTDDERDSLGLELNARLQRPSPLLSLDSDTASESVVMADAEDSDSNSDSNMVTSSDENRPPTISQFIRQEVEEMYAHHYESTRERIPRMAESFLHHILLTLKNGHPDFFQQQLRVSPYTFDQIVAAIEDDTVFENSSESAHQAPVEEQLAVVLYHFGHDGNAAGLQGVANWAGIGKGAVLDYTKRVLTALLRPEFMKKAVHLPTEEEKEKVKQWVEDHSCRAWRNGTLIPLYARPYWYGESYFDRKCRYSLNMQVCSMSL